MWIYLIPVLLFLPSCLKKLEWGSDAAQAPNPDEAQYSKNCTSAVDHFREQSGCGVAQDLHRVIKRTTEANLYIPKSPDALKQLLAKQQCQISCDWDSKKMQGVDLGDSEVIFEESHCRSIVTQSQNGAVVYLCGKNLSSDQPLCGLSIAPCR